MRYLLYIAFVFILIIPGCGPPDELTLSAGHSWYKGVDHYSGEEAYNTKGTEIGIGFSLTWYIGEDD